MFRQLLEVVSRMRCVIPVTSAKAERDVPSGDINALDSMGYSETFVNRDRVSNTISRVENHTGGSSR